MPPCLWDPEMHQTWKVKQGNFGTNVQIGVDMNTSHIQKAYSPLTWPGSQDLKAVEW